MIVKYALGAGAAAAALLLAGCHQPTAAARTEMARVDWHGKHLNGHSLTAATGKPAVPSKRGAARVLQA